MHKKEASSSESSFHNISNRKKDHIRINLEENVQNPLSHGLDEYFYEHEALPEINLDEIDLSQTLFQKSINYPILISSMTGGTKESEEINKSLAIVAEKYLLPIGLGSQRAAIENEELSYSFKVRQYAPNTLIFGNLGAVQLNYGFTIDECKKAIDMIEADGLFLHLNPLQEALQPEGQTDFSNLVNKIEEICKKLSVPVIAKEVGSGISKRTASLLYNAGISAIDVAGSGGTSWALVEKFRAENKHMAQIAETFGHWGIPTDQSILNVKEAAPDLPIIASGGIKNGLDIAKCISMGAKLGGLARPFLQAATISTEELEEVVQRIIKELMIVAFSVSAKNLTELEQKPIFKKTGNSHEL